MPLIHARGRRGQAQHFAALSASLREEAFAQLDQSSCYCDVDNYCVVDKCGPTGCNREDGVCPDVCGDAVANCHVKLKTGASCYQDAHCATKRCIGVVGFCQ